MRNIFLKFNGGLNNKMTAAPSQKGIKLNKFKKKNVFIRELKKQLFLRHIVYFS